MLINKIRERNKEEGYSELRKIQMLTQVIHTSEPQKLIEELESSISGEPTSVSGNYTPHLNPITSMR